MRVGWTAAVVTALIAGCGPKTPPAAGGAEAAAPSPTPTAESASGPVFAWRVADSTVEPELLTGLLTDYYDVRLLLSPTIAGGEARILVGSALSDGTQDRCAPTTALTAPIGDGGAFTLDGASVGFAVKDVAGALDAAKISGAAAADGLTLGAVAGRVDTRAFLSLLGSDDEGGLCDLMPAMGPCVPCADGAARCWNVGFRDAKLSAAAGTALVPRTQAEICADAACSGRVGCP